MILVDCNSPLANHDLHGRWIDMGDAEAVDRFDRYRKIVPAGSSTRKNRQVNERLYRVRVHLAHRFTRPADSYVDAVEFH